MLMKEKNPVEITLYSLNGKMTSFWLMLLFTLSSCKLLFKILFTFKLLFMFKLLFTLMLFRLLLLLLCLLSKTNFKAVMGGLAVTWQDMATSTSFNLASAERQDILGASVT